MKSIKIIRKDKWDNEYVHCPVCGLEYKRDGLKAHWHANKQRKPYRKLLQTEIKFE